MFIDVVHALSLYCENLFLHSCAIAKVCVGGLFSSICFGNESKELLYPFALDILRFNILIYSETT